MDPIQLLDRTKAAFTAHQAAGNRYHYPEALKNDAVSLLSHHSATVLSRLLGISAKSLANWQKGLGLKSTVFVPLTLTAEVIEPRLSLTQPLILKLPHQVELVLPAQPIQDTVQLISCLMRELSACCI